MTEFAEPNDELNEGLPANGLSEESDADSLGEPTGDDQPEAGSDDAAQFAGADDSADEFAADDFQTDDVDDDAEAGEPEDPLDWYILKVQSNREDSISDALQRRVKIHGLEQYVDRIIVPSEKVKEINPKTGKQRTVRRKLFPGYIVVHMAINDDTWFLIRETPGIGDFTGSGGKPMPMLPHEVERILALEAPEEAEAGPKLDIKFKPGDRVKIIEGNFEGFEGAVDRIDEKSGRVTVMIMIFGRETPVDFDYWQVHAI